MRKGIEFGNKNEWCGNFTGIDISPKTIERAKEHLVQKNVKLICADFGEYVFECKYDVIYSSLTFMHFHNTLAVMKKISNLLSENGHFVLSIDKNPNEYIDAGNRRVKIYPDNRDEITECIEKARLKLKKRFETEFAHIFIVEK